MSLEQFFYDDLILPDAYHSVEVDILNENNFLKIKETLTRMGLSSRDKDAQGRRTLWQSAHILHKQGKYYIVHFKELFLLDGNKAGLTEDDMIRRNMIAELLQKWNLLKILDKEITYSKNVYLKVVPFKAKQEWNLQKKYTLRSDRKYLVSVGT